MPLDRYGRPVDPHRTSARAIQQEVDGPRPVVEDSLHVHQLSRSASAPPREVHGNDVDHLDAFAHGIGLRPRQAAPAPTLGDGRLHTGVVGAHPMQGGRETTEAEHELTERTWPSHDVSFTMGPQGRDTMDAGMLQFPPSKPHVDTEPYARRSQGRQHTMPLFGKDDAAAKPTDMGRHWLQLNHPHLGNDYDFHFGGGPDWGHSIHVYHRGVDEKGVAAEHHVGEMRWAGAHGDEEGHQPGEITWIKVRPHTQGAGGEVVSHAGKGIATAMWDYAQYHVATSGAVPPVHSSNRSTAGNHWAHFVGGASLPRTEGHDRAEYHG